MNEANLEKGQELLKKIKTIKDQLNIIKLATEYYHNSLSVAGEYENGHTFNRLVPNIIPFNEFKARCIACLENTLSNLEIEFDAL